MFLTDAKIRTLKPSDKPFKVSDSHGLYLLVKPGGSRHWYLKYRISGKESRIALGAYQAISCLMRDSNVKVSVKCWR